MPSNPEQRISHATRKNVFDWLSISGHRWSGRLEHPAFLSRLYDLEKLPSTDFRYATALADIYQHVVNNYDWEDDWVFSDERFQLRDGPDEAFLDFIVETVHPLVQGNSESAAAMVSAYNSALRNDGFELYESDRFGDQLVYTWRDVTAYHALAQSEVPNLTDNEVLRQHLQRVERDLDSDPSAAIDSCKNFVESQCKIVLATMGGDYSERDDLPGLFAKVSAQLKIDANSVEGNARGSAALRKAMRALTTTVQSIAEARNAIGDGHGSGTASPATPRHAHLVFNATVAVTRFIADTVHEQRSLH